MQDFPLNFQLAHIISFLWRK